MFRIADIEFVRAVLSREELLAQLAEEATELAHAALKLRRVYVGTNPTPVPLRDALDNLMEEIADVQLLLEVLELDQHWPEYGVIKESKIQRWVSRLEAKNGV